MPFLMRVLTNAGRRDPPRSYSPSDADRSGGLLSAAVSAVLRPAIGDHAAGHGVSGTIAVIPDHQPLADDGIWRVTLAAELFGRLVRRGIQEPDDRAWQLLQIDDLSDEQLDAYETSMHGQGQSRTDPPF